MSDQGGGPRIRPLAPGEEHAFRLLRLRAAEWMPYFGRALFAVQPVAAPGLRTFAVDAHWRLYMDPGLLVGPSAWPVRLAAAVALHEIMHLVRDHAGRTEPLPAPVHPLAWNLATDAEINDGLLDRSRAVPVPLQPGGVLFFHGMLPHFTPENRSDKRRRALQFHFRGRDTAIIPKEEYLRQFRTGNGEFASCLLPDTAS